MKRNSRKPFLWWWWCSLSGPCLIFTLKQCSVSSLHTWSRHFHSIWWLLAQRLALQASLWHFRSSWSRSNAEDYRRGGRSHTTMVRCSVQLGCRELGGPCVSWHTTPWKFVYWWFLLYTRTCVICVIIRRGQGGGGLCRQTTPLSRLLAPFNLKKFIFSERGIQHVGVFFIPLTEDCSNSWLEFLENVHSKLLASTNQSTANLFKWSHWQVFFSLFVLHSCNGLCTFEGRRLLQINHMGWQQAPTNPSASEIKRCATNGTFAAVCSTKMGLWELIVGWRDEGRRCSIKSLACGWKAELQRRLLPPGSDENSGSFQ